MIKKLRHRFVLISSLTVMVVLMGVVGVINSGNVLLVYQNVYRTTGIIIDNGGELPTYSEETYKGTTINTADAVAMVRYYSVIIDEDGAATLKVRQMKAVDDAEALSEALKLSRERKTSGRYTRGKFHYVYAVEEIDDGTLVVVMDANSEYYQCRQLMIISMTISLAGLAFFVIVMYMISTRAIAPAIRNYRRQQEFITNAGHELKTPVAIISANAEVEEMINGESEEIRTILTQTKRLSGLIDELMRIARMTENVNLVMTTCDLSQIVRDQAAPFDNVARAEGKNLVLDVSDDVSVRGEERMLSELVTILTDNAVKYCDEGGTIIVKLGKHGRNGARLLVTNNYLAGKNENYDKFFERFYRADTSHSAAKKGYGIGLSMAQTIVLQHKGKMKAFWKDGLITFEATL